MYKKDIPLMPVYFDRYIDKVQDVSHQEALSISLKELEDLPLSKWEDHGDQVYAPGKWTLKQVLQHCIDVERVFMYRTLSFARGDRQKMLTMDESLFAENADVNHRTLYSLIEEYKLVRMGFIALVESFTPEMLLKSGLNASGNEISVLAMIFTVLGHQKWHFDIVGERYFA